MEWLPPCCDMSRLGDRQASRRVDGSPLREEEQEEDGEYPHLSPCPPLEIHFHSSFFYLCQLPCRTLRDSGAVEAWVRGPAIHSSLCLSFWARGIYGPTTGRRPREKEKARWLHLRGTSAKPRSNRTPPAQTGPMSPSKLLRPIIKIKVMEISLFHDISDLWILWELKIRHWSKSVLTLCPPYPPPTIQSNMICKIKQDVWRRMRYTYCRQQNHPFPSTLLTSWGDVRSNYLNRINNRHLQCFCCGWANWAFANISLSAQQPPYKWSSCYPAHKCFACAHPAWGWITSK